LADNLRASIESESGVVFTRASFESLGGYDQVGRALRQLCSKGVIEKASHGLYAKTNADPLRVQREIKVILSRQLKSPERSRRISNEGVTTISIAKTDARGPARVKRVTRVRLTQTGRTPPPPSRSASGKYGLRFPYDWSNPNMPTRVLIQKVLERAYFNDILAITAGVGIEAVTEVAEAARDHLPKQVFRKLDNIARGLVLRG